MLDGLAGILKPRHGSRSDKEAECHPGCNQNIGLYETNPAHRVYLSSWKFRASASTGQKIIIFRTKLDCSGARAIRRSSRITTGWDQEYCDTAFSWSQDWISLDIKSFHRPMHRINIEDPRDYDRVNEYTTLEEHRRVPLLG